MSRRLAILLAALSLVPQLSNAAVEREVSWWTAEGGSITINDVAANYSEWWGVLRIGSYACAIKYGRFMGQESARVLLGTDRGGRIELSHLTSIRGTYMAEYGPEDPQRFYKGATALVYLRYFRGDTRARTEILGSVQSTVFSAYESELSRECEHRLKPSTSQGDLRR